MNPKQEQTQAHIPVVKHFKDDADLKRLISEGYNPRDAPLLRGQEKAAQATAASLVEGIEDTDTRVTLLIASPKLRTVQTAFLIEEEMRRLKPDLKIRVTVDENLRDPDYGSVILPETHSAEQSFLGYKIADKIFRSESSGSRHAKPNIDYKFGDPVLRTPGTYTYPKHLH